MWILSLYFELGPKHGNSLVVPADRWYCKIVWSAQTEGRILSTCLDEFVQLVTPTIALHLLPVVLLTFVGSSFHLSLAFYIFSSF
jgi:hypothetical protein